MNQKSDLVVDLTSDSSTIKFMNDFLGNTISVGDLVVYPTRRGGTMKLNKATVVNISEAGIKIRWDSSNRTKVLPHNNRLVVVTEIANA